MKKSTDLRDGERWQGTGGSEIIVRSEKGQSEEKEDWYA